MTDLERVTRMEEMFSDGVKLDEFDKVEWFDVAKQFLPELTQEKFNVVWDEFQELKRKRGMQ